MEPVVFPNAHGERLFGILHMPPAGQRSDRAILLLSPGVKMRVAPHRLYNEMAEDFLELGFPVLRFDFAGLGDAEGEIEDLLLAPLYGKVQVGSYKGDTRAAMDWMKEAHGVERFILAGLCGGAITGLLTASDDPRVEGLLGLGTPVILDDASVDSRRFMTQGQLAGLRRGYLRRLVDWRSWLRLLTLRTDFRMLWRAMAGPLARRRAGGVPSIGEEGAEAPDNFNPLFPEAFFAMAANDRPVCFVFSGADRLHHEFEEKFATRYAERLKDPGLSYEQHLLPEANHILSSSEHKAEMLRIARAWLQRHFA